MNPPRRIDPILLALILAGSIAAVANSPGYLLDALEAQAALAQQNPEDAAILNDLANLQVMADRLIEAEASYRRAAEIAPYDPTIRYNLALVLMELGESKEALHQLQTVLESSPQHAWAHYQLGTLEAHRHNRRRALEHYARAFALDWSLASPAVNPHIVENRLATDAMLRAYLSASPASVAPRLFRQPEDVAALLVPMPADWEEDDTDSGTTVSRQPQRESDSSHQPTGDEVATSEESRVLTESDLEGRTVSTAPAPSPRRRARPRRQREEKTETGTPEATEEAAQSTVVDEPSGEPTREPTRQPRTVTGSGVTGVVGIPVVPSQGTVGQPTSTGSTGRLDLELLPTPPTRRIDAST